MINLVDGHDPWNAYINITTYETERYTWIKDFYILVTTLGG